jgi:hypothetical protein
MGKKAVAGCLPNFCNMELTHKNVGNAFAHTHENKFSRRVLRVTCFIRFFSAAGCEHQVMFCFALNVVCFEREFKALVIERCASDVVSLIFGNFICGGGGGGRNQPRNVRRVGFLALCPRPEHTTINNPARLYAARASRPLKGCRCAPNFIARAKLSSVLRP